MGQMWYQSIAYDLPLFRWNLCIGPDPVQRLELYLMLDRLSVLLPPLLSRDQQGISIEATILVTSCVGGEGKRRGISGELASLRDHLPIECPPPSLEERRGVFILPGGE
jgi:hypothetical protein